MFENELESVCDYKVKFSNIFKKNMITFTLCLQNYLTE